MRWTKKQVERAQVETVFGLGGGELETKPWSGRQYWYHGAPHYADNKFGSAEVRTAIECLLFGQAKAPRGWAEVECYRTSGEAECWACYETGDKSCRVCDGDGLVYLGDGWCEVVYCRRK